MSSAFELVIGQPSPPLTRISYMPPAAITTVVTDAVLNEDSDLARILSAYARPLVAYA